MDERREEARKVTAQLNAKAVVALIERQNYAIKEFQDVIDRMNSRVSLLEQAHQQDVADKFKAQAEAMGSGSTDV